jgi:predicted AlkP superfamily pyrophosphatase or phosphodiesterase
VPTITGTGPTGAPAAGLHLSRQDGEVVTGLLDPDQRPPMRVVGILLDGANPNVLYDAALNGEAPTVRRMIEEGTAFAQGALASLPTVTLPNHTAILTGCHPGHHGVLHNAWYDRVLGRQVITESPATWQEAMDWLAPGVETIHHALKRTFPGAVSISINEPADAGADYSTFDLFRSGDAERLTSDRSDGVPPHATEEYFTSSRPYRRGTLADAVSIGQAKAIWAGHHLGVDYELPTFMWVATSLTDAAFHEGGPHSHIARAAIRDTDARVGEVVAAVEKAGAGGETAYVLVADHGMEHNAEDVTGDWGEALAAAGLSYRDEASGFLYLGI